MLTSAALVLSAAALASAGVVPFGSDAQRQRLKRSNTVTTASSLSGQSFDYVIVGGGTAGLVMAGRLSENASVTVAVIEAGVDATTAPNEVDFAVLAPGQSYFAGIAQVDSVYDWQFDTVPQPELNDREVYWPRGKILGGSSAVNGLYMIRHSEVEQNSWADIVNDSRWNFESVWPYMKKSETWTLPSEENVNASGMVNVAANHGTDGPVHFGYPGFFYPQSNEWIETLGNLGVGSVDPAGGGNYGSFIAASAIDSTQGNWTRSYSKTAYLDPAANRTNLVVLSGYYVTKINFDGTLATGVSFAASATDTVYTVNATSEVILSGGVIGTPHLLQLSGVGDSALLTGFGIDVVKDLPGVGMHMTDHLSAELSFAGTSLVAYTGDDVIENATYAAEQKQMWYDGNPDSLYNSPNDAVAYVNLTTLMGAANASAFLDECKQNASAAIAAYTNNTFVAAGYNATYQAEIQNVLPSNVGAAELLLSNTGTYSSYIATSNKTVSIQAAIQHPLSRGSVKLNSTSVFDAPLIDPGYLTHPADIQVLVAAFKYALKISQTAPLADYLGEMLSPGTAPESDADWETWLRKSLSTEYHPASTASMLPEEAGGVVDGDCLVYGVQNLRIVDSSIVPVGLSAHMTAPLYGIAERVYGLLADLDEATAVADPVSSAATASSTKASTSTSTSAKSSTKASSVTSAAAAAATSGATSASDSTTSGAGVKAVTGAVGMLVAVTGAMAWM